MPRPTRLAALVVAVLAIASAALPVPVYVPFLLFGGIAGASSSTCSPPVKGSCHSSAPAQRRCRSS